MVDSPLNTPVQSHSTWDSPKPLWTILHTDKAAVSAEFQQQLSFHEQSSLLLSSKRSKGSHQGLA